MSEPSDASTDIFPMTNWSLLRAAAGSAPHASAALDELCARYRHYGFGEADAEDLTQEYFVRFLNREFLGGANPEGGRFRAFLRTDVKWFLHNARRKRSAARRGGGREILSLDRLREEGFEPSDPEQTRIDDYFDRQCALEIVRKARERLADDYRHRGKEALFQCLQVGLAIPAGNRDYGEWGRELGLSPGSVKVAMHRLRDRFRRAVEELVRDSVVSEEDFHLEMAHLRKSLSHEG